MPITLYREDPEVGAVTEWHQITAAQSGDGTWFLLEHHGWWDKEARQPHAKVPILQEPHETEYSVLRAMQERFKTLAAQPRKSGRLCLGALRIRWFDPIAETAELPDHPLSAPLLGLFGDGGAPFFVTNSLVQDQPDQPTLSMSDSSDGLLVSETRYCAAIDDFEDASFGLYGSVRSLIE